MERRDKGEPAPASRWSARAIAWLRTGVRRDHEGNPCRSRPLSQHANWDPTGPLPGLGCCCMSGSGRRRKSPRASGDDAVGGVEKSRRLLFDSQMAPCPLCWPFLRPLLATGRHAAACGGVTTETPSQPCLPALRSFHLHAHSRWRCTLSFPHRDAQAKGILLAPCRPLHSAAARNLFAETPHVSRLRNDVLHDGVCMKMEPEHAVPRDCSEQLHWQPCGFHALPTGFTMQSRLLDSQRPVFV